MAIKFEDLVKMGGKVSGGKAPRFDDLVKQGGKVSVGADPMPEEKPYEPSSALDGAYAFSSKIAPFADEVSAGVSALGKAFGEQPDSDNVAVRAPVKVTKTLVGGPTTTEVRTGAGSGNPDQEEDLRPSLGNAYRSERAAQRETDSRIRARSPYATARMDAAGTVGQQILAAIATGGATLHPAGQSALGAANSFFNSEEDLTSGDLGAYGRTALNVGKDAGISALGAKAFQMAPVITPLVVGTGALATGLSGKSPELELGGEKGVSFGVRQLSKPEQEISTGTGLLSLLAGGGQVSKNVRNWAGKKAEGEATAAKQQLTQEVTEDLTKQSDAAAQARYDLSDRAAAMLKEVQKKHAGDTKDLSKALKERAKELLDEQNQQAEGLGQKRTDLQKAIDTEGKKRRSAEVESDKATLSAMNREEAQKAAARKLVNGEELTDLDAQALSQMGNTLKDVYAKARLLSGMGEEIDPATTTILKEQLAPDIKSQLQSTAGEFAGGKAAYLEKLKKQLEAARAQTGGEPQRAPLNTEDITPVQTPTAETLRSLQKEPKPLRDYLSDDTVAGYARDMGVAPEILSGPPPSIRKWNAKLARGPEQGGLLTEGDVYSVAQQLQKDYLLHNPNIAEHFGVKPLSKGGKHQDSAATKPIRSASGEDSTWISPRAQDKMGKGVLSELTDEQVLERAKKLPPGIPDKPMPPEFQRLQDPALRTNVDKEVASRIEGAGKKAQGASKTGALKAATSPFMAGVGYMLGGRGGALAAEAIGVGKGAIEPIMKLVGKDSAAKAYVYGKMAEYLKGKPELRGLFTLPLVENEAENMTKLQWLLENDPEALNALKP